MPFFPDPDTYRAARKFSSQSTRRIVRRWHRPHGGGDQSALQAIDCRFRSSGFFLGDFLPCAAMRRLVAKRMHRRGIADRAREDLSIL
jgi:hypothetical protein